MGSCVSVYPVKQEEQQEEIQCGICYDKKDYLLKLNCNHEMHAECLVQWWMLRRDHGLVCPMCRGKSYGCYMELGTNDCAVGYYRQDHEVHPAIMLRNISYQGKSRFVSIADMDSRDLALSVFVHKYHMM